MDSSQQFIDTRELASRTGICERTWERKRLAGDGPPFTRIGARVVYEVAALSAWLAANTFASTAAADLGNRDPHGPIAA